MDERSAEQDPMIGQVLNSYRLEEKLGEGGMAAVYRASHILFEDRVAAVKVLLPSWAREEDVRRRFELALLFITHNLRVAARPPERGRKML